MAGEMFMNPSFLRYCHGSLAAMAIWFRAHGFAFDWPASLSGARLTYN